MNNTENNKIIAEFMGLDKGKYPSSDGNGYYIIGHQEYKVYQLEYDISWDWLMPVIEKCYKTPKSMVERHYNLALLEFSILTFDIKKAHKTVIEFIKWYNKNK